MSSSQKQAVRLTVLRAIRQASDEVHNVLHLLVKESTMEPVPLVTTQVSKNLLELAKLRRLRCKHLVLIVDCAMGAGSRIEAALADSPHRDQYDVRVTASAAEAQTIFDQEDVHLIMTDWWIPERADVAILKWDNGVKPLIVKPTVLDSADSAAAPVWKFICKPVEPWELDETLFEAAVLWELLADPPAAPVDTIVKPHGAAA